jgi:cytoskeletal protein CcmA (bactofilin family)
MKAIGVVRGLVLAAVTLGMLAPAVQAQAQGSVRGRCTFLGQNVTVPAGEVIGCGSLRVLGGNAVLEPGAVTKGDVQVIGGNARIQGQVDGRVLVVGGDLGVADSGRIAGDALATGSADVKGVVAGWLTTMGDVDLGPRADVLRVAALGSVAQANGATVHDVAGSGQGGGVLATLVLVGVFSLLSALFAALLVALAPQAVGRVRDAAIRAPLLALLVGAVAWGLGLVLFVPLVFTVVGPLILVAVLVGGSMLGWVGLGLGLGERLLAGRSGARAAAAGGAILALLTMLVVAVGSVLGGAAQGPVMCLGIVTLGALWTWGLGAGLVTVFGSRPWSRRGGPSEPSSAPADGPPGGSSAEVSGMPLVEVDGPAPGDEGAVARVAVAGAAALGPAEADAGTGSLAAVSFAVAADAAERGEADGAAGGEAGSGAAVVGGEESAPVRGVAPAEPDVTPDASPTRIDWDPDAARADVRSAPGISPIYAFLLHEAGLGTVGELASATPDQVRTALAVPGVASVDDDVIAEWIAGARRLATGN